MEGRCFTGEYFLFTWTDYTDIMIDVVVIILKIIMIIIITIILTPATEATKVGEEGEDQEEQRHPPCRVWSQETDDFIDFSPSPQKHLRLLLTVTIVASSVIFLFHQVGQSDSVSGTLRTLQLSCRNTPQYLWARDFPSAVDLILSSHHLPKEYKVTWENDITSSVAARGLNIESGHEPAYQSLTGDLRDRETNDTVRRYILIYCMFNWTF